MKWLMAALLVLALGSCGACDFFYYRQAREVRRLASGIEGLEVLDVDGNHDVTLESLWLDAVYRGTPVSFTNVTPASFRDVEHLQVAQVGGWGFSVEEFEAGPDAPIEFAKHDPWDPENPVQHFSLGGSLDFGPAGDIGTEFDPPIRSIPEFLARLPEVVARIERLPEGYPGVHLATGRGMRWAKDPRGRVEIDTWIWVRRERVAD